jgi:hypothetical protein
MKKLWCNSDTAIRALAASALTMVAWLEHPHLTLPPVDSPPPANPQKIEESDDEDDDDE